MLKFTPNDKEQPQKGDILLAEPFMEDPYFRRTVILLCEHNEEGSFGFVLNNYIDASLEDIMDDLSMFQSRISVGGPVKHNNLYYLHTLGDTLSDSIHVTEGIYMGGNFEELKELALAGKVTDDHVRFFVGYAGWSPDQLMSEVKSKSWFISSSDQRTLMDTTNETLWNSLIKKLGKEYSHLADLPPNPSLN
ncbi:MAG: YqgE/AlgH family protein [Flavobacteriales bacterium]|uniref:YqgE/AlgH family protein n=1 Tax=Sanyastnella coralliicola TaxID=3069118 RepID=UPI0027BA6BD1|nr:YqgE/AlgH family protein [Longitalea sp. SCSIO 12813]MCH2197971.1 YqgE/AlgH family protein [Flavobacteriales bacterium]